MRDYRGYSVLWVACSLCILVVSGSYRQYHMDNADVCANDRRLRKDRNDNGGGRILNLGTGASIFKLDKPSTRVQPNDHNQATKCEIHVQAPKDYGITVHVETMRLRTRSSTFNCVDYIQFGIDDIVPFYTFKKSDRLCGEDSGFTFNDPKGNLLIWVTLGGRRATTMWPHISVVNLTLIVTAYKTECSTPDQTQIKCKDSDRCIWNKYVCDRHINCPEDKNPADEEGCTYDRLKVTSIRKGDSNFNFLSLVLIVVSLGLIGLLITLVLVKRNRRCCFKDSAVGRGGSCDLPEQSAVFSLRELSHVRQAQDNIYLPLSNLLQRPSDGPVLRTDGADEEGPPPAYDELFPEGQRRGVSQNLSEE